MRIRGSTGNRPHAPDALKAWASEGATKMCSRYSLTSPAEAVRAYFKLAETPPPYPARYNIAPTQPVAVIRQSLKGMAEFTLVRWGLIPNWVRDPREFATLINARAESAAEKPSFRGSLRHRRCLVPTNGFYEWTGRVGHKVPHLIRRPGAELMAFAGLWEHWLGADGSELETMAILTVDANPTVAAVHDRMPVTIAPEDFDRWLDCRSGSAEGIGDLMVAEAADRLEILTIDPKVSNSRNEGPELWTPVPPADKRLL